MPNLARITSPPVRESIRPAWVCLLVLLVFPRPLYAQSVGGYETVAGGTVALLLVSLVALVVLRARVRRQSALVRAAVDAEAELAQRHRNLIESANDVIFRLDDSGRVSDWNRAGERLLGFDRASVVGRPLSDFATPGGEAAAEALIGDGPPTRELALRSKAGIDLCLEVSVHPLATASRPRGVEGIGRDVTERKRLEEQLRHSQKMEAIGHLAGGVAHDFNNLLTVINGNCELLLRETPPGDTRRALIEEVKAAGTQAAAVTRQLLAFGRKTVLAPKTLDLNGVVRGLGQVLRRLLGEPITLHIELDPGLDRIRADIASLEQVILNLAVNARDAMPDGGVLKIRTETVDRRWVRLIVGDTGVGMDGATLARIFEPYFTTKPTGQGTGLGLAMVQGVVEQSGGRIHVNSAPGRGATFKLDFPALPADSPGSSPVSEGGSSTPVPGHREVVLLVEDEPAVQLLERRVLEGGRYRVLTAGSGEEALALLDKEQGRIDLLVTDVVMPGMTGRELAEEAARRRPGLRTLFLSGYTPDEVLRQGVRAEEAHFLQKPFTPSTLLKKVREMLAGGT
jgi:two-component system, cell cycle sensor histidine kinase and response regulator CckA